MKMCSWCKKPKSLSEFYKNKSRMDGHSYCCKQCSRQIDAVKYAKKKERKLQQDAELCQTS